MVYRPKINTVYWYTDVAEDGSWRFATKENHNDWEDIYHISMGNCYHTEDEAAEDWYRLMQLIKGDDV